MRVLVTNDDGIAAPGLWTLVGELRRVAEVVVAAPDGEKSAIGTAVSLRQPLKVQSVTPRVPGVEAYSVAGTPGDSVIVALDKLVKGRVDVVVSGINQGSNLGDDVFISGTVGGALQGYLHHCHAVAVSVPWPSRAGFGDAGRLAAALVRRLGEAPPERPVFLNANLPDLPLAETRDIVLTRVATGSHTHTTEERLDEAEKYYWVQRQRAEAPAAEGTDLWAIDHGHISISPLHVNAWDGGLPGLAHLFAGLLEELLGA